MTTLQDAMFLGYDCLMVEDCVGTTSPEYCMQATLYNVKLLFGFVTGSAAIAGGPRTAGAGCMGGTVERRLASWGWCCRSVRCPSPASCPSAWSRRPGVPGRARPASRTGRCRWRGPRGRSELDLESGRQAAAAVCALNLLAALREACGGRSRRRSPAACAWAASCKRRRASRGCPQVIDGASELFIALWGEAGRHARTSVGVATLPQNAAVEVDAIFELRAPP